MRSFSIGAVIAASIFTLTISLISGLREEHLTCYQSGVLYILGLIAFLNPNADK